MKHSHQRGVTLILSMIMLVLLTIVALSTFNIGKSSLQIVDNAQQQSQAQNASQAILDQVVSSPTFAENPAAVLDNSNCPTGVSAPANSRCVDVNGDGKMVFVVTLTPQPTCSRVKVVLATDLNVESREDLGCALGESQNFGTEGVTTNMSLCADSLWEIQAQATDPASRAEAVVDRGVSMRVSNDAVATACPS
jgi:Tfp pilus assembly protein PilV